MTFKKEKILKYDAFGQIEKGVFINEQGLSILAIKRVYAKKIYFRPIAKYLASNEKKAIKYLEPYKMPGLPKLLEENSDYHVRSYVEGGSMHHCVEQLAPEYFSQAKKLLKAMRKAGVANNDLAKEANWLVTPKGMPAVTDFQLALCFKKPGKMALNLYREDLRHLLKHKRKYSKVTLQEKAILEKKSWVTRLWMATGKKVYLFVTRKILRWEDRQGPEERNI